MWQNEVSITIEGNIETIWDIWSDVEYWNKWDNQVESSRLYNGFGLGAKGYIKPINGPKSEFVISELTNNVSFTTESSLPLGKMFFIHEIREEGGVITLTHKIEISGLLTFLFSRVIGKKIISELPNTLNELSVLVSQRDSK